MAEEHNLPYVPEELEEQILARLPAKSILRFKSVCKRWHSLLRSKAFEEFYFGLHDKEAFIPTSKDLCLICPELQGRGRRGKRRVASVIGPLRNGIYALTSFLWSPHKHSIPHALPHTLKIALFNPATRQVKFADPFPDDCLELLSAVIPQGCEVSCGIDDDYRVVVVVDHDRNPDSYSWRGFLVFMYTWRTGLWEKLVDYDPYQRGAHNVFENTLWVVNNKMACSQKLLNGCWHWMTIQGRGEGFGVLSFDFEGKSLEIIPGPPGVTTFCADVLVLQDHLAAVLFDSRDCRLKIWRKTETAWTNVYEVNISQSFRDYEAILHGVYYHVVEEEEEGEEEEPASIKIKRLVFIDDKKRITFDEHGHMMEEVIGTSNPRISLSVDGISKFTPTFELLPL